MEYWDGKYSNVFPAVFVLSVGCVVFVSVVLNEKSTMSGIFRWQNF